MALSSLKGSAFPGIFYHFWLSLPLGLHKSPYQINIKLSQRLIGTRGTLSAPPGQASRYLLMLQRRRLRLGECPSKVSRVPLMSPGGHWTAKPRQRMSLVSKPVLFKGSCPSGRIWWLLFTLIIIPSKLLKETAQRTVHSRPRRVSLPSPLQTCRMLSWHCHPECCSRLLPCERACSSSVWLLAPSRAFVVSEALEPGGPFPSPAAAVPFPTFRLDPWSQKFCL